MNPNDDLQDEPGIDGRCDADEGVGAPGEWYSRGYLPHRDRLRLLQSVTFRLADSLPKTRLLELEAELKSVPSDQQDSHRRRRIEAWLDAGMGCCALRRAEAAACVRDVLLHFHGQRYELLAWVIMPNHVHVLIDPATPLFRIVQTWKSISSRRLLEENDRWRLGIPDSRHVWMREYWDRFIRDEVHFRNVVDYIHGNPVKAGLCGKAEDWAWSSERGWGR
jgi:type I restriction enzyme R subunit/putative DNA methylase